MALLNKKQILSAPLPHVDVDVLEWGGSVRVQAFSGLVRVELLDAIYANESAIEEFEAASDDVVDDRVKPVRYDQALITLLFAIVDENGQRLFGLEDYAEFTRLGYDTQISLWRAFQNLTLPKPAAEQKKSTASTRKGSSSSGSRSRSVEQSKS